MPCTRLPTLVYRFVTSSLTATQCTRSDALLLPFTVASGVVLDNNTHAKGP